MAMTLEAAKRPPSPFGTFPNTLGKGKVERSPNSLGELSEGLRGPFSTSPAPK